MGVSGRQPGGVGGVLDGGLDSILPCLGSVRACVTDARRPVGGFSIYIINIINNSYFDHHERATTTTTVTTRRVIDRQKKLAPESVHK